MSRTSLQAWLLAEGNFRLAFDGLEADAVRAQFPQLQSTRSEYQQPSNWPYLLFCASILAPSDIPSAEEKALRIAQSALIDANCLASERDAALLILDALSNRRSIQLAEERHAVRKNLSERLGVAQSIDWSRRSFEHRIELTGNRVLYANKFQRRFWNAASRAGWLSVSAPTSAGKSFILAQWLAERMAAKALSRVVYIAPTRALVQQVDDDLRAILAEAGLPDVEIRSVPFRSNGPRPEQEVLVFTQERLHYYLQTFRGDAIDALIIDEAHKVGDSHRGILLQDVIEQVTAANPGASVMFTAPLTDNPEALLSDAPSDTNATPLRSDDATVSQNLLWLEPHPEDPKFWQLILRRGETSTQLGFFETARRLPTIKGRLAKLATLTDCGEGGILVYANGAARAEEIAAEIASLLDEPQQRRQVAALDELCRRTIHKDYRLRNVLRKGVAFHYGNMPLLLRTAIEGLFREGHIRYLVCTSTLVEGINLPCRTILIHAPKKGGTTPMTGADFWNLAGRAGRWGKEFQGNVICVDTQDTVAWGTSLPTTRNRYRVERTTDRLLTDEARLRAFIDAGAPSERPRSDEELETAVSYLAAIRQKHKSLSDAPWRGRIERAKLARIDEALAEALSEITLPEGWITRHAGISPFAMHRMLRGLQGIRGKVEAFLPIDPEDRNAGRQYGRIFEMMGHHMTGAFGQGARCHALGILTTNWMLGHPIKQIIAARIKWNKKKKPLEDTATAIRKTLEDVEQIARFQAPRYLACYSDIMRHMLALRGEAHIADAIPDLTLSLEFGVRGPVQLGLMTLGLSRSATLAIADPLTQNLAPAEVARAHDAPALLVDALRKLAANELGLPALVLEEVLKFQANLERQQGGE